jgi:hypothetical protein
MHILYVSNLSAIIRDMHIYIPEQVVRITNEFHAAVGHEEVENNWLKKKSLQKKLTNRGGIYIKIPPPPTPPKKKPTATFSHCHADCHHPFFPAINPPEV